MTLLKISTHWLLGALVAVQGVAVAATIDVDTVLGPDHPYHNQTITVVDGVNPPTDLTILEGAGIGNFSGGPPVAVGLDLYGSSRARMLGGGIRGFPHNILLHDTSVFRMDAGSLDVSRNEARDESLVILNGGSWHSMNAYDSSRILVNGGDPASTFEVETFGESHAMLNNESFNFAAHESSTAVLNSGNFESAVARGNSEILINGGFYHTGIFAFDNATVRFRHIGSILEEYLDLSDAATAHFYGTGLRFDVLRIDDDLIPFVLGNWANGENFGIRYYPEDQGQIILHEVPEPGSWALLAVGAAGMYFARRRWCTSAAGDRSSLRRDRSRRTPLTAQSSTRIRTLRE